MDGAILLFVVAFLAILIGLFVILWKSVGKTRREYEASRMSAKAAEPPKTATPAASPTPPAPSRVTSTVTGKPHKWDSPKKKEAEPEIDLNKVSIYTYRPAASRSICPYCDGENPETADTCLICGQALR